jgi:O-antigen biosynthesis protein
MSKQILVMGMHRSGTSMVSRILNLMGCYYSSEDQVMLPAEENPKGFWERKDVMVLNNKILHDHHATWDNPYKLKDIKINNLLYSNEIKNIIFKLEPHRPWFIKDPRFCLTYNCWANELEHNLNIVVLRNPLAVSISLFNRNKISYLSGLALWDFYTDRLIKNLDKKKTILCFYDDFLQDPYKASKNLFNSLKKAKLKKINKPIKEEVMNFVNKQLNRSKLNSNINLFDKDVIDFYTDKYNRIKTFNSNFSTISQSFINTEQQAKTIDTLNQSLSTKDNEIHNLSSSLSQRTEETEQQAKTITTLNQSLSTKDNEIHNLSSSLSQRTEETEQQAKTIETLDREIKKVMSSNSYKYTAPLRELRRIAINPIDRLKYYIGRIGTAVVAILKRSHHHLPISYKVKRDIYKTLCIRPPGFFGPNAGKSPFIGPNHLSKFIIDERQNNQSLEKMLDAMLPIRVDEAPLVSVIIPVYGKINFTLNCLSSISENLPLAAFEVIVVDDCSPDSSVDILSKVKGIRVQRNENNQGFIRSCNIGAKAAKGQYLYFLNNDTIVTTGWLDELLRTFHEFPGTGLVGSKLVYPDGRLQEAGGIIWNDASGWNYGNGKDKDHINFNYARDVDYCSGASIMISKKLFFELGMFDNYFAPAYYEDTDLAFKVREKGLRVIYQPLSEVIHFEGATSGTDINSGAKQYQKINKEKFFTRYQDLLTHHNTSGEHVDKAIDRTRIKNCLVIDTITPEPDRDSGSIDTYNQLMFLHNYGFHVTFIPLDNFAKIEHYTQQLQKKGIKCIYHPYYKSVEKFCSDHQNFFDLILINREENFTEIYPLAKKYFPKAKLWLHNVDLGFIRLARQAKIEKNFKLIKRAKEVKNSEITNNINSDISTVVSPFEINYLQNKNINCELLPLFRIKNQKKIKTFDERNGLVFIAGFNHLPNQDALTYFLDDIFPSIQNHLPEVQCSIIGNNLPKNLLIRIKEFQNIQYYADKSNFELEELVNNHKIGIAPLRYGAGTKGKVITYIANHLPFVASHIALEGINLHTIKDCIYHSNTDFVEKIVNLYKDKALYENVQKEISFLYDQNFSEACYKTSFSNILHKLNLP